MSDTESVKGDSSEEEMEEINDDEEKVLVDESMLKNGNDTEITVNPGNIKVSHIEKDKIFIFCITQEVSWPPLDTQAKPEEFTNHSKLLPNLSGTVHIGKDRRRKMELEIQNFQGSTANYLSNPFSRGFFFQSQNILVLSLL